MPGEAGRYEMHATEPVGKRFQAPTSSPRGLSLVTSALLAGGLALRVAIALRPLARLDGLTIPDDAYLCLTIARSFGRGLGPYYTDAFTNGFQPLYVLLMAPFYALFPGHDDLAVHVALLLLVLLRHAARRPPLPFRRRVLGRPRRAGRRRRLVVP